MLHKRMFYFPFAALFFLLVFTPLSLSQVSGTCSNCHVLHESENPVLLKETCLGCHGQDPTGDLNIVEIEAARFPQILHSRADGDLAAGNFRYAADALGGDYGMGHNVNGLTEQEDPPMDTPPGFIGGVIIPGGKGPIEWGSGRRLECAGAWGCHGNRTIEDPFKSLYGAHHEDDATIDGSTVGKSYRFLYGVTGREHPQWEYLAATNNHNGYRGDRLLQSTGTISYLCGQCHAQYHPHEYLGGPEALGVDAWHRHPAEISFNDMKNSYRGSEYEAYEIYDLNVPMGFAEPTGEESEIGPDSVITCLTCHRAHGSPYDNILRWDYGLVLAGTDHTGPRTGCQVCHSRK